MRDDPGRTGGRSVVGVAHLCERFAFTDISFLSFSSFFLEFLL